ncbi:MAG: hypothetical protein ETSY1_28065 [Candidatus Entotheonella factor]|uniref:Uncharacterized protein n=1 Tax=Entotheonella factor TaxID=1429438 RepID=W4LFF5_ENTF1|nr:MAG: hypothetical protein ETSY1_28065 [Candidatus Entotheonella factor]
MTVAAQCAYCQSNWIAERSKTARELQYCLFQNAFYAKSSLRLNDHHWTCSPEVKQPIIVMKFHDSGLHTMARSPPYSKERTLYV